MAERVRHLISPYDCTGKVVPVTDRLWTRCGRFLCHVWPRPKRATLCKVCVCNRAKERRNA